MQTSQEDAVPLFAEPRAFLANKAISWNGIGFVVASEDISRQTVWHLKPDTHSVVVHLAGSMSRFASEVEGGDAVRTPPAPGKIWLVPAQTLYAAESQGDNVRYAELRISPEAARDLIGREASCLELRPRLALNDEFIYQAARLLEQTVYETDDLSRMLAQSVGLSVACHVLRTYADKPAGGRKPLALRRDTKQLLEQYIHDNLGEPILLNELAALAKMTTHTLLRAFKVSFGASPASYIVAQRISAARSMLAYSNLDITAIAMATGFSSHSHLSTTFRKFTGVSPRDFRRDFR